MFRQIKILLTIFIFVACSDDNANYKSTSISDKHNDSTSDKIIYKKYYRNGKIKSISELNKDSVKDGITIRFDSTGNKTEKILYKNGKFNGPLVFYYENKEDSTIATYSNDSIILKKWYHNGKLTDQHPINPKDIGKMKVTIGNGKRNYFTKNKIDTVTIEADNLPILGKVVSLKYAKIKPIDGGRYTIEQKKDVSSITIFLSFRFKDTDTITKLDSVDIKVK